MYVHVQGPKGPAKHMHMHNPRPKVWTGAEGPGPVHTFG